MVGVDQERNTDVNQYRLDSAVKVKESNEETP